MRTLAQNRIYKVGLFLQTDKNFAELSICGIQEESFIQLVIKIIGINIRPVYPKPFRRNGSKHEYGATDCQKHIRQHVRQPARNLLPQHARHPHMPNSPNSGFTQATVRNTKKRQRKAVSKIFFITLSPVGPKPATRSGRPASPDEPSRQTDDGATCQLIHNNLKR